MENAPPTYHISQSNLHQPTADDRLSGEPIGACRAVRTKIDQRIYDRRAEAKNNQYMALLIPSRDEPADFAEYLKKVDIKCAGDIARKIAAPELHTQSTSELWDNLQNLSKTKIDGANGSRLKQIFEGMLFNLETVSPPSRPRLNMLLVYDRETLNFKNPANMRDWTLPSANSDPGDRPPGAPSLPPPIEDANPQPASAVAAREALSSWAAAAAQRLTLAPSGFCLPRIKSVPGAADRSAQHRGGIY